MVGLDVKAMRTQPAELATRHLSHSREMFLRLVALSRSLDRTAAAELVTARDYEALEWLVVGHLLA
jgi:xylose isomerase